MNAARKRALSINVHTQGLFLFGLVARRAGRYSIRGLSSPT